MNVHVVSHQPISQSGSSQSIRVSPSLSKKSPQSSADGPVHCGASQIVVVVVPPLVVVVVVPPLIVVVVVSPPIVVVVVPPLVVVVLVVVVVQLPRH